MQQSNNAGIDGFKTSLANSGGAVGGAGATLSTLANYPKAKINKLISEARPLIGGARKCKQIWLAMRKADFRKEGLLNETNIKLIFETQKHQIYDLLRLQTPAEFLEVFDQGADGQLNEDEQILVFSCIKEKMQILAEELCFVQEYQLYKDLMREVRALEIDINQFQNELRTVIQQGQLREYIDIGDDKLKEFYVDWEQKFVQFEDESLIKIEELKFEHEQQMEMLNVKLDRAVEAVKIKPSINLKDMQKNEKLVAVNERVEEAMNYRKELKILEIKEAQRIENERQHNAENQRKNLLSWQSKEMHQLEAKIETGRHNLKIRMEKDLVVLQKQINLHVNDIKRIQGLMSRQAHTKGEIDDELRRLKDKSRKTLAFLSETKKVQSSTIKAQTQAAEGISGDRSMKQTMFSGQGSSGAGGGATGHTAIVIDLLLFGQSNALKKGNSLNNSLSNTQTSTMGHVNQVQPLKYLLKHAPISKFEISVTNEDGSRRTQSSMGNKEEKAEGQKSNAAKIQFLLDQRKPPTEKLQSLCAQYDDDLNFVGVEL